MTPSGRQELDLESKAATTRSGPGRCDRDLLDGASNSKAVVGSEIVEFESQLEGALLGTSAMEHARDRSTSIDPSLGAGQLERDEHEHALGRQVLSVKRAVSSRRKAAAC